MHCMTHQLRQSNYAPAPSSSPSPRRLTLPLLFGEGVWRRRPLLALALPALALRPLPRCCASHSSKAPSPSRKMLPWCELGAVDANVIGLLVVETEGAIIECLHVSEGQLQSTARQHALFGNRRMASSAQASHPPADQAGRARAGDRR